MRLRCLSRDIWCSDEYKGVAKSTNQTSAEMEIKKNHFPDEYLCTISNVFVRMDKKIKNSAQVLMGKAIFLHHFSQNRSWAELG